MFRVAMYLIAWFAFLVAAVAFAARFVPVINHAVLFVAALSPYLTIAAGLAALLLLLGQRSLWAATPALMLIVAAVLVQLPLFIGSGHPAVDSIPIRVLTANLRESSVDPEVLVALARDHADLLVVQELTPELADALNRYGLESQFPYHAVDARRVAAGVGIWSRYPITRSSRDSGYRLGMVTASLRVPGTSSDTTVLAAHLVGPWPQPIDGWRQELAQLPDTLSAVADAAGAGAVIVAGDLNATADMQPFRRLLQGGFNDAADQAGAGLTRTFPADKSFPPLIGIDHILTFNSSASDLQTVRIPGSDHLGLSATIHVPK